MALTLIYQFLMLLENTAKPRQISGAFQKQEVDGNSRCHIIAFMYNAWAQVIVLISGSVSMFLLAVRFHLSLYRSC